MSKDKFYANIKFMVSAVVLALVSLGIFASMVLLLRKVVRTHKAKKLINPKLGIGFGTIVSIILICFGFIFAGFILLLSLFAYQCANNPKCI